MATPINPGQVIGEYGQQVDHVISTLHEQQALIEEKLLLPRPIWSLPFADPSLFLLHHGTDFTNKCHIHQRLQAEILRRDPANVESVHRQAKIVESLNELK